MVLFLALACVGLAIVLFVVTMTRPAGSAVDNSLAMIENAYSRSVAVEAKTKQSPSWLRGLAGRLSPADASSRLQYRLDLAGNPTGWNPDRVLASKGLGLFLGAAVLGPLLGYHALGTLVISVVVGAVAGFFLPDVLLFNAGQKRQQAIRKALPDALDMLTVCVEAGLGFDAALAQVARNTTGPLAMECARVLQEMQIGKSRNQALRSLTERTTVTEFKSFVSALVQAGDLGVPIAQVLREQAKEMRTRRRQRAEEMAQKVPVKILFPLVACIFPTMFVVIIGPGAISIARVLLSL